MPLRGQLGASNGDLRLRYFMGPAKGVGGIKSLAI